MQRQKKILFFSAWTMKAASRQFRQL